MNISKVEKEYNIYREWIDVMDMLSPLDVLSYLSSISDNNKIIGCKALYIKANSLKETRSKNMYRAAINSYNLMLSSFSNLVKKLELDNSLSVSILYAYLLWNGYFSFDLSHIYNNRRKMFLIPGLLPFDVVRGYGSINSHSVMLRDCLNACGYCAASLTCGVSFKTNITYCSSIFNKEYEYTNGVLKNFVLYPFTNSSNYSITIVDDNNKLYGFDSTNLMTINILDNLIGENALGSELFRLNPNKTLLLFPYSDNKHLFDKLFDKNRDFKIDKEVVKNNMDRVMNAVNDNKQLLKEFYDNNRIYLSFINHEIEQKENKVLI